MANKMNIPFSPPDITQEEIDEVAEALRSGWITTGPRVKELERQLAEYLGVKRCVCLNSQTACAEMALRVLGVGPGDEVIVPAYTYTASASVICHVGATPVMVDCASDSLEMDYEAMARAITEAVPRPSFPLTWVVCRAITISSSRCLRLNATCFTRPPISKRPSAGWRYARMRPMRWALPIMDK